MYVGNATREDQGPQLRARLGQPTPRRPSAAAGCANPLSARAKAIIRASQDSSRELSRRAVTAVWYILYNYFRPRVKDVSAVIYREKEPGLTITRIGSGSQARGLVEVGRSFIEHMTARYFARRVLQVGHELTHLDQWRSGLTGSAKKDEREFLAFFWEATAPEKPGTGCVSHATRVALIDAALGYLNCLGSSRQASFLRQKAALSRLRTTHQAASNRPATSRPTTCVRR